MERLSFLSDEHVPTVVVTTLRSNGYTVVPVKDRFEEGTSDQRLLEHATDDGLVVFTNDRDFVRHGHEMDHAGIVIYTTQELQPGSVLLGIERIDGHFSPETMRNNIEWLEDWFG